MYLNNLDTDVNEGVAVHGGSWTAALFYFECPRELFPVTLKKVDISVKTGFDTEKKGIYNEAVPAEKEGMGLSNSRYG